MFLTGLVFNQLKGRGQKCYEGETFILQKLSKYSVFFLCVCINCLNQDMDLYKCWLNRGCYGMFFLIVSQCRVKKK